MSKPNKLLFHTLNSQDCSVYKVWSKLYKIKILRLFRFKRDNLFLMNAYHSAYSEFIEKSGIKRYNAAKLIVFGYADSEFPLLHFVGSKHFISHEWFDIPLSNCVAVFFVPNGAELLSHQLWAQRFPSWVSFQEGYEFLTGIPIAEEESTRIYPKIFKAINKYDTADQIRYEMEKIYSESIERLSLSSADNEYDLFEAVQQLKINKRSIVSACPPIA